MDTIESDANAYHHTDVNAYVHPASCGNATPSSYNDVHTMNLLALNGGVARDEACFKVTCVSTVLRSTQCQRFIQRSLP